MYLLTLYQPGVRAIHAIDVGKWSWSPFVILRCGWWKRRSPMDLSPIRLGLSQSLSTSPFWQESRQVAYCNATRARSSDGFGKIKFLFLSLRARIRMKCQQGVFSWPFLLMGFYKIRVWAPVANFFWNNIV